MRITEELDYRREAATRRSSPGIYRGHPFIHVPEVIGELCTDRVLTQELVRGSPGARRSPPSRSCATSGRRRSTASSTAPITRFCLFNADPHPGNYLFHDDGSVSFLDFGCVKRFQPRAGRHDGRDRARDACATTCSGPGGRAWRAGSGDPRTPSPLRKSSTTGANGRCGGQSSRSPSRPEYAASGSNAVLADRPLGQRFSTHHRARPSSRP